MKTSIENLTRQIALLTAFAEHFKPGDRLDGITPLDPDNLGAPAVTFYGAEDREWILSTFGATGWKTSYKSDGWQHVHRYALGVKVTFYQACRIDDSPATPQDVDAALLTGREAGIALGTAAVRESGVAA